MTSTGPPQTCPRSPDAPSIVTGANSGLGEVTARELARVGAKVILAVRNTDKGEAAAARHDRRRRGAQARPAGPGLGARVRRRSRRASTSWSTTPASWPCPYAQTVDGFESQIGTNHLGHFALTNLLLPKITDRVVTVSSLMHLMGYISLNGSELEVAALLRRGWPTASPSWPTCCSPASCSAGSTAAGSPLRARRCPPRLLAHQPAGQHPASQAQQRADVLRQPVGHRRRLRRPADAVRASPRTCRATASSARAFVMRRPQPAGRRAARWPQRAAPPRALWELSEQLTDTKFPL